VTDSGLNNGNSLIGFGGPIANGGFTLESSPVLETNAVWTPVSGAKSVVGSNYQPNFSPTNAAAFFRLHE
jgi:hypothetical protein